MGDEVHGNDVSFPLRNIQRLQHTTRPLMLNLRFLTHQAGSDVISHICLYTGPLESSFQIFIHLSHTWVYAKTTLMPLI